MIDVLRRYLWKLLTYTHDFPTQDDIGKYCWLKTNRLYPTEHLCKIAKVDGEEGSREIILINVERQQEIEYSYRENRDFPWFCVWNRPVEAPHIPTLESEWEKSLIPTDIVGKLTPHKAIFWMPSENNEDVMEFCHCMISDGTLIVFTPYGNLMSNKPVWIVKFQQSIFLMEDEEFQAYYNQVQEVME